MGLFNRKKTEETVASVVEVAAAPVEAAAVEAAESAVAAEVAVAEAVQAVEEAKAAEAVEEAVEVVEEAAEAVEEAVETVEEAAPEAPAADSCGGSCAAPTDENQLTRKEVGTVYQVRMNYHAGYNVYKPWPNGGRTIHAGIGWFHPFGPSEYYGMANIPGEICEESKQFPLDKFFTDDWMENFETDLFCIYRMPDGDIYAWDGMFAVRGLDPSKCIVYNSEYTRQDVLVNVIVGGTGRYEGVRGLLIGTAEGGGITKAVGEMPDGSPLELPETIMKDLSGYIRFPE